VSNKLNIKYHGVAWSNLQCLQNKPELYANLIQMLIMQQLFYQLNPYLYVKACELCNL